MTHRRSERFKRSFKNLPLAVRRAFFKQLEFLLKDIQHPSLRAKKYDEVSGLWQARVTRNVRFYFLIEGGAYFLVDIEKHKD